MEKNAGICISCGNSHGLQFYEAKEMMFGLKRPFRYLGCPECGSVQLMDKPENMAEYYDPEYYAFAPLTPSSFLKNSVKKLRWSIYKQTRFIDSLVPEYFGWLKKLDARENNAIADIGCGNGQLLYEMHCAGFHNLWGFDPFIETEFKSGGLNILRKGIEDIEDRFDIVMLHHSFEHMDNPHQVFPEMFRILKPNGKLLIRVPVTDGEVWKKEGVNWFQLDAPRHLYIPSVKAMEAMGKQYGLELQDVVFDSTAIQFVGTEAYKRGIPFVEYKINQEHSAQELASFQARAQKLNTEKKGDQAGFYYQKKKRE
jgi:SAM-dependent methyltransferase